MPVINVGCGIEMNNADLCGLCDRILGKINIDHHHLIPKMHGGKETVPIHKICHRKIHSLFTEKELQKKYYSFTLLRENEDIRSFIKWVQKKDPDFYDGSFTANRKRK